MVGARSGWTDSQKNCHLLRLHLNLTEHKKISTTSCKPAKTTIGNLLKKAKRWHFVGSIVTLLCPIIIIPTCDLAIFSKLHPLHLPLWRICCQELLIFSLFHLFVVKGRQLLFLAAADMVEIFLLFSAGRLSSREEGSRSGPLLCLQPFYFTGICETVKSPTFVYNLLSREDCLSSVKKR